MHCRQNEKIETWYSIPWFVVVVEDEVSHKLFYIIIFSSLIIDINSSIPYIIYCRFYVKCDLKRPQIKMEFVIHLQYKLIEFMIRNINEK